MACFKASYFQIISGYILYSVLGLSKINSETDSSKKGVAPSVILTLICVFPYFLRFEIRDLGFHKYAVSAGTTICVSETATERMAEGNMFPPKSSTISNVVCSLL